MTNTRKNDYGNVALIAAGVGAALALAFGIFLFIFFVHSVAPGPGEEAVLVDKPRFGGHEGVRSEPVRSGRKYLWSTTDYYLVNIQPFQMPVHFDDFNSSDGIPMDFDSVIRMKVVDSVSLIRDFGPKWYENNVVSEFTSRVRQAVRRHHSNNIAIDTTAIDEIDSEVSEGMKQYIKDAKLPIILVGVTVGKANPPDPVKNQRIETAAQQQRKQTEEQKKVAEDARKAAEASRAAADNAYREAMQLSPEQFLRLEEIKMRRDVCAKGGCTFLIGTGVTPTLAVK